MAPRRIALITVLVLAATPVAAQAPLSTYVVLGGHGITAIKLCSSSRRARRYDLCATVDHGSAQYLAACDVIKRAACWPDGGRYRAALNDGIVAVDRRTNGAGSGCRSWRHGGCSGMRTGSGSAGKADPKTRDPLQRRLYVVRCNEPRAFELTRRALVTGAPQEISVIEPVAHVVPTAVAGVIVDDPIGGRKFVRGVRKSADHHHRCPHRPGKPRQTARQADKQRGMFEPACASL